MAASFPKLPGFVPTQDIESKNFRKISAQKQEANREIRPAPSVLHALPNKKKLEEPDQSRAIHPDYVTTTQATYVPLNGEKDNVELYQPDWAHLDRHVLRFYGYFKESVVESRLENFRIRKLILYYYLEDNSVAIIEPKQMNSGIPQGAFLKRQKVLKSDGSGNHISVYDFVIGKDIMIFGKNIRLFDCDDYTREFYFNLGSSQPEKEQPNSDNFEMKTLIKYVPQRDHMMKDFMEHKLGGGRVTSQKQFLENDRKVLKFHVYSEIPYIMHYYLADDTIEIREVKYANSGRDDFPVMLKRQKLPKKFSLNQPGQTYEEDYINPQDVKYGEELKIFGRIFQINGCDYFTQKYYKDTYHREFPLAITELQKSKESSNIVIPPYNGFGDEEDSLGYVYRLIPKPPKKDYFKWVDNQKNLRFKAKLNTTKPEDVDRQFIITFFLNDDSLSVYEPTVRNSGIPDGKFLEKKRYKNPEKQNNFFNPSDLIVGKDVKINGFSFHLIECDEFTRKWYAENFRD